MTRRPIMLQAALVLIQGLAVAQATLTSLVVNGDDANRINIVILSEGYKQTQMTKFITDANAVLNKLFQQTQPFKEYASYFNAYAISVASVDSGADHPQQNDYRNTYFGATYYTNQIDRLLTISSYSRVYALLDSLKPTYDAVLIIVNDPEYGGSGGSLAVISTHPSNADIAIHELGHSFGDLGDEYSDAYPGYPDIEEPNTTRDTVRATIKWRQWILGTTPIPTTTSYPGYASVVGLFEGAHYHTTGWYRPKYSCEMRSLGNAFCEVCRQQLVLSVYALVRSFETASPASSPVALVGSQSAVFSVAPLVPATHGLIVRWYHNGTLVPGATGVSHSVSGTDLGNGTHRVRAEVKDTTIYVRNDPSLLLRDTVGWTVNVSGVVAGLLSDRGIPERFALSHNYPNPFNPSTFIEFSIPDGPAGGVKQVTLRVFDLLGRAVATLVEGDRPPGVYRVRFTATELPSGVYLCRLQAGSFSAVQKIVLMK